MSNEAILVHGWNTDLYTKNAPEDFDKNFGWSKQPELTRLLSTRFSLNYYTLPGFCGTSEPPSDRFDVEDFADNFGEWKDAAVPNPSVIIGYSFGGAVILNYKARYKDPTPVVLISPAIYRGESARSDIARSAKKLIPEPMLDYFKHLYQLSVSPYYRKGTPFLRSTYDTIVRRDLRPLLDQIDPSGVFLIYGLRDVETPWNLVKDEVEQAGINYHLISDGGHKIGITHPREIIQVINDYLPL